MFFVKKDFLWSILEKKWRKRIEIRSILIEKQ